MQTTCWEGTATGVIGPRCLVVADVDPGSGAASTLQAAANAARSIDDVVVAMLSLGLAHLPDLAAVVFEDDGARVVLRGRATAVLHGDGAAAEFGPRQVSTWLEGTLEGATEATIALGPPPETSGAPPPAGAGTVLASALRGALDTDASAPQGMTAAVDPAGSPADAAGHGHDVPAGDDLDDATIGLAQFRAMQAARQEPARDAGHPKLVGVLCPAGHPNPPYAGSCRSCATTIIDRTEQTVDRPVMGELLFEDGSVVEVSAPVLIGRRPVPEVVNGEQAELVEVPDPDRLLSRTHVEIRIDGWRVQLVDRGSVNHTFVQPPGQAAVQLAEGEPCPLVPGTSIQLSESTAFTFVVPRAQP